MPDFKPRLLRETAEIALTEIKRFLEPRLMEQLQLRRVSAPLFLPVDSPWLDHRCPGARVAVGTSLDREVEIVGSLDVWLRGQLALYDIAPGFGVYTIMNALRPRLPHNSTSSPHIAAWAWQQAAEPDSCGERQLVAQARTVHQLLVETERTILNLFPHMSATLHRELRVVSMAQLESRHPDATAERALYEWLHPENGQEESEPQPVHLLVAKGSAAETPWSASLWVWNRLIRRPVKLAELEAWRPDAIGPSSIGGNIYRDFFAMQILQQDRLLTT